MKILEPKFQGQTKDRLTNAEAPKLVNGLVKDNFELWLGDHVDFAKKLVEHVIENAQKRTRAEVKVERKRGGGNTTLPGKLADCEENNPEISMVGAQIDFINEKNEIIGEKIGALEHEEIVKKMTSQIQLFHPVIMFRNHQNIKYREKFIYCEDYDLYLNLITQGKKLANINEKLLHYRILESSISRKGDNFVKKLMVEKALYFYKLRKENGQDLYETFNNEEVLEINNLEFKNKIEELFFALETAIKLNKKEKIVLLIKKIKKHYPKEKIPFKYVLLSSVPLSFFRVLKKLFSW